MKQHTITSGSDSGESQTIRILIIEDNRGDVLLSKKMLRRISGSSAFEFKDVARMSEALSLLERESFDVVLLDLGLLDSAGVMSVAALHAKIPKTPIIVYSGTEDPKLREQALMCGATSYLTKGEQSLESLQHAIEQQLLESRH